MDENQHILVLSPLSGSIEGLMSRVEGFGYSLINCLSPDDISEIPEDKKPKVAVIDINKGESEVLYTMINSAVKKYPSLFVIGLFNQPINITNDELENCNLRQVFKAGFEDEFFINTLFEVSPIEIPNSELNIELLTRINILEIENVHALPFDVFVCLPANKKIIHYATKGQSIDPKRVEKFKKNRAFALYIRKPDSNLYTSFSAAQIQEVQNNPNLSSVEKQKAMDKELKTLMNGYFVTSEFDDKEGDQLLANVGRVLFTLEDESGSKEELMSSVEELTAQNMTSYTHSHNVATYSVMFGLALGINEPESLKIGGFLHDIGLGDFDPQLTIKDVKDLTASEMAQFKLHPGNAKLSIQMKKLKVPEVSLAMVLEHHEHTDGTGFPYGKKSDEIHPAAKVCAFADEFDHLTSIRFGYVKLTPSQAMRKIAGLDGEPPSPIYDETFHKPLLELFLGKEAQQPLDKESIDAREAVVSFENIKPSDAPKVTEAEEQEIFSIPEEADKEVPNVLSSSDVPSMTDQSALGEPEIHEMDSKASPVMNSGDEILDLALTDATAQFDSEEESDETDDAVASSPPGPAPYAPKVHDETEAPTGPAPDELALILQEAKDHSVKGKVKVIDDDPAKVKPGNVRVKDDDQPIISSDPNQDVEADKPSISATASNAEPSPTKQPSGPVVKPSRPGFITISILMQSATYKPKTFKDLDFAGEEESFPVDWKTWSEELEMAFAPNSEDAA